MNALHRVVASGALASLAALPPSFAHADGAVLATYQGADRLTLIEQAGRQTINLQDHDAIHGGPKRQQRGG